MSWILLIFLSHIFKISSFGMSRFVFEREMKSLRFPPKATKPKVVHLERPFKNLLLSPAYRLQCFMTLMTVLLRFSDFVYLFTLEKAIEAKTIADRARLCV